MLVTNRGQTSPIVRHGIRFTYSKNTRSVKFGEDSTGEKTSLYCGEQGCFCIFRRSSGSLGDKEQSWIWTRTKPILFTTCSAESPRFTSAKDFSPIGDIEGKDAAKRICAQSFCKMQ
uniref:Uncharacterized protein n=1 Tax=Globisporangium ultimum (strain ATCC 200006 / CBS 805.95 / DAOM BR144) TaxID=431595 RepID=K3WJJ7_GLOUD